MAVSSVHSSRLPSELLHPRLDPVELIQSSFQVPKLKTGQAIAMVFQKDIKEDM
ncbi:hypothetical protein HHK36_001111 [Tetracentron sinense]|uniref:Uncharacterized protein n=1 Tax=Tetracentron sinense TaxID=13715 RepID=A0A834ZT51_TETSI|nr:hypothetical protein HHK36_001111 [Tetracentron sinense]